MRVIRFFKIWAKVIGFLVVCAALLGLWACIGGLFLHFGGDRGGYVFMFLSGTGVIAMILTSVFDE